MLFSTKAAHYITQPLIISNIQQPIHTGCIENSFKKHYFFRDASSTQKSH